MTSSWMITEGSRIGPHHKESGVNQDAYLSGVTSGGVTFLAVADGAGSLSLSHEGAQLAVQAIADTAQELESEESLGVIAVHAVVAAQKALLSHKSPDKVGCTLAAVFLREDSWSLLVVGDAFVVLEDADKEMKLYTNESSSEYANITELLTSSDFTPLLCQGEGEILSVAVCSDGMEHSSVFEGKPFAGFWKVIFEKSWREDLDIEALFDFMDTNEKIYDDTTLVVASKKKV